MSFCHSNVNLKKFLVESTKNAFGPHHRQNFPIPPPYRSKHRGNRTNKKNKLYKHFGIKIKIEEIKSQIQENTPKIE